MEDGDRPATKGEVEQIAQKLKDSLIEHMRDMQTELLRGFSTYSEGTTTRMRKLEADQSNLDVATRKRFEGIEDRLARLEKKLGGNEIG